MDSFKNIWKVFVYIALGLLMVFLLNNILVPEMFLLENYKNKFAAYVSIALWVFSILFFMGTLISSIIKVIYHMILYCYYTFFYGSSYSKIHLKIDENDIIRESYVELKNKKIVPIEISRVIIKKPEVEEENQSE